VQSTHARTIAFRHRCGASCSSRRWPSTARSRACSGPCTRGNAGPAGPGREQDPWHHRDLLMRYEISHFESVPSLYQIMLELVRPGDLPALRSVVVAGEACPAELWTSIAPSCRRRRSRTSTALPRPPCGAPLTRPADPSGRRTCRWGRPSPMPAYVLDSRGLPVPDGVAGELCVGGLGVTRGYLRDPGRTAAAYVPDPYCDIPGARLYRSGDRVRYLPGGELEFLGRVDSQLNIRVSESNRARSRPRSGSTRHPAGRRGRPADQFRRAAAQRGRGSRPSREPAPTCASTCSAGCPLPSSGDIPRGERPPADHPGKDRLRRAGPPALYEGEPREGEEGDAGGAPPRDAIEDFLLTTFRELTGNPGLACGTTCSPPACTRCTSPGPSPGAARARGRAAGPAGLRDPDVARVAEAVRAQLGGRTAGGPGRGHPRAAGPVPLSHTQLRLCSSTSSSSRNPAYNIRSRSGCAAHWTLPRSPPRSMPLSSGTRCCGCRGRRRRAAPGPDHGTRPRPPVVPLAAGMIRSGAGRRGQPRGAAAVRPAGRAAGSGPADPRRGRGSRAVRHAGTIWSPTAGRSAC